jgi:hypothetical protein
MTKPTGPGYFIFTDQPGNAQRVRVAEKDGELVAYFYDIQPDDEPVLVDDMMGKWEPGFPWEVRS